MPFVTQAYLTFLEQQLGGGGGGGGSDLPAPDLPPITPEEPTTAPAATPASQPYTPPQWPPGGYGTGYVPAPTDPSLVSPPDVQVPPDETPQSPPYVYNDPYGTGDPGNINIPYPGDQPPTSGPQDYPPAEPAPPTPDIPIPGPPGAPQLSPWGQPTNYANIPHMIGNLFRNIAGFFPQDPGGFGQPMGYFPWYTANNFPGAPSVNPYTGGVQGQGGTLDPGGMGVGGPLPGAFGYYGLGGGGPISGGPSSMMGGRTGQGIYGMLAQNYSGATGGGGGSHLTEAAGQR